MRILLIVDCYLPSTKSSAKLMHDLAVELLHDGHEPTILTPVSGLASPLVVTQEDGVCVARVRSGQIKGASRFLRGMREALLSDVLWYQSRAFLTEKPHDVIVFYSPSIFFGKLVRRLKRLWRCQSYLIVRDLFPQWALDAGVLRRGPAYYFFKAVEFAQYETADVIGVQSPTNLRYFDRPLHRARRIEVLYNWTRVAGEPIVANDLRARLGWRDKVVFVYGGNMGVAQDMDAIVRLACALSRHSDARFLLVGDGSEAGRIRNEVARLGLINVAILDPVQQAEYLEIVSGADVGLIALNGKLTTQNIPGKLLGYLEMGLPVLASLNTGNDLVRLLEESNAGFGSPAGDDEDLRKKALLLLESVRLRREMGLNARRLLADKFSARSAARQIVANFEKNRDASA